MRRYFDEELKKLNNELLEMGRAAEHMVHEAYKTVVDPTPTPEDFLQANEDLVDQKESIIQNHCFRLILEQQPVASDLRRIASILKMISDIERIGDQAHDIAELSCHLKLPLEPAFETLLKKMHDESRDMLREALDAFVLNDPAKAEAVILSDDGVDQLFMDLRNQLIASIRIEKDDAELFLDLLMIGKYFERIADHTVNIAEWLLYAVRGETHNPGGTIHDKNLPR